MVRLKLDWTGGGAGGLERWRGGSRPRRGWSFTLGARNAGGRGLHGDASGGDTGAALRWCDGGDTGRHRQERVSVPPLNFGTHLLQHGRLWGWRRNEDGGWQQVSQWQVGGGVVRCQQMATARKRSERERVWKSVWQGRNVTHREEKKETRKREKKSKH